MQGGPPAKKRLLDFDKKWHMAPKHTDLQDRFFAQATEVDIKFEDFDSNRNPCEIVSYWGNFQEGNFMPPDSGPAVWLEHVDGPFINYVHYSDSNVEYDYEIERVDSSENECEVPKKRAGRKKGKKRATNAATKKGRASIRAKYVKTGKLCATGVRDKKTGYHSVKVGATKRAISKVKVGHGGKLSTTTVGNLRKKEKKNKCERDESLDSNIQPYKKRSYTKRNMTKAVCRGKASDSESSLKQGDGRGKGTYSKSLVKKGLSNEERKQPKVHIKKRAYKRKAESSAVDNTNKVVSYKTGYYKRAITNGTGRGIVSRGDTGRQTVCRATKYGRGTVHRDSKHGNTLKNLAQDFILNTDGTTRGRGRGLRRGPGRPPGRKTYLAPPGGVEANSIEPGPSRKRKSSSSPQTVTDSEDSEDSCSNTSASQERKRYYKRSLSKSEEVHNRDTDSDNELSDDNSDKTSAKRVRVKRKVYSDTEENSSAKSRRGRKITVGRKAGRGGKVAGGTKKGSVVKGKKVVAGAGDGDGSRGKRIGFYSRLQSSKGRGRGGKGSLALSRGLLSSSLKKRGDAEGPSYASDDHSIKNKNKVTKVLSGGVTKRIGSRKRGGKAGNRGSTRGRKRKVPVVEEESDDDVIVVD